MDLTHFSQYLMCYFLQTGQCFILPAKESSDVVHFFHRYGVSTFRLGDWDLLDYIEEVLPHPRKIPILLCSDPSIDYSKHGIRSLKDGEISIFCIHAYCFPVAADLWAHSGSVRYSVRWRTCGLWSWKESYACG